MADAGALPPTLPRLHEPGVYLDLPMQDYVDDPAISGSGLKKLLTSPSDFKWELPNRNPLFTAPESDARALGTMVHCAVLEGMDAFHHNFFVAPALDDEDPRVMRTADQAKNWLKDRGEKCTGLKADLFERVRACAEIMRLEGAAEDELPIFLDQLIADLTAQGNGRRVKIKQRDFDYVAQVERVVRSWPDARQLLSGGLPEVSIFWVENGIRFKARLDYLSALAIVDLKKFGLPPIRGQSLRTYLQFEAVKYCYDIQAVHNSRATMQIPLLLKGDGITSATGAGASDRLALLEQIGAEILRQPPTFHWLFLRTPGPPQGLVMPFPAESRRWSHCESDIEEALRNLAAYRDQCGDELDAAKPWIEVGVAEWDDDDLREYHWEIAR